MKKSRDHTRKKKEEEFKRPRRIKADVVVIGGGAAGRENVLRHARAGRKVLIIEKGKLGGSTAKHCVGSKTLIKLAEKLYKLRLLMESGILEGQVKIIVEKIWDETIAIIKKFRERNYEKGIKNNLTISELIYYHDIKALSELPELGELGGHPNISVITGEASFQENNSKNHCLIGVKGEQPCEVEAQQVFIATGSRPNRPSKFIHGAGNPNVWTYEDVLEKKKEAPKKIIVIGGGIIGCEFAQFFRRIGSDVTVLERNPNLLSFLDSDIGAGVGKKFAREGIRVCSGIHGVKSIEEVGKGFRVTIERKIIAEAGKEEIIEEVLEGDKVLLATGVRPNIENLNLDAAGIVANRWGIKVDKYMSTTNPRVFAGGDVVSFEWGAKQVSTAMAMAIVAYKNMSGKKEAFDPGRIFAPIIVFTDYRGASVGMSEKQALAKGYGVTVCNLPMDEVKRCQVNSTTGVDPTYASFIKMVVDDKTQKVLGMQIFGPRADSLAQQVTEPIKRGEKVDFYADTSTPYLTMAECVVACAKKYQKRAELKSKFGAVVFYGFAGRPDKVFGDVVVESSKRLSVLNSMPNFPGFGYNPTMFAEGYETSRSRDGLLAIKGPVQTVLEVEEGRNTDREHRNGNENKNGGGDGGCCIL